MRVSWGGKPSSGDTTASISTTLLRITNSTFVNQYARLVEYISSLIWTLDDEALGAAAL